MNRKYTPLAIAALMIVLTALSRIFPHFLNFSPLCAISMFGAAYFTKKWYAYATPLLAAWLSDLVINNTLYAEYYPQFTFLYNGFIWQYLPYILITNLSFPLLKKITVGKVFITALSSTLIFFLISNFGSWVMNVDNLYARNFSGLINCYILGIPFIKGTLTGTLFYSIVLFGGLQVYTNRFSKTEKVVAND